MASDDGEDDAEEPATRNALGLGGFSFVGLDARQTAQAVLRFAGRAVRQPGVVAAGGAALVAEELRILTGSSDLAPDAKDRRFADPAWQRTGWRQVVQSYLALRAVVDRSVDELDLDDASKDRARFGLMQLTEAAAPSNVLLLNPVAIRRAFETRGASLRTGARHLAHDVRHNGGIPSQVDTRPFEVGGNLAATPGSVVWRTDQFELIQYHPSTPKVRRRPLLIIPPQINRYYFLDLAPGRSFVEYALSRGQQVFIISWRNPQEEHRHWSLDTYVSAIIDAIEHTRAITRTKDVNTIAFCAGGMTQSILLGYLRAVGRPLVNAAALGVTMIDTHRESAINSFATERSIASTIGKSRKAGGVKGRELARVFAWIRPNDLIWNYWVSNYLLGENPPAFDVLAWNADATNLPNQIHEQFLDISMRNALLEPGGVSVLGHSVDLRTVDVDHYSVGAATDHLVPWQACYEATQLFSGGHRFVLSNSGHIQALVNPPTNPKASYFVNDDLSGSAEEWLAGAARTAGSWWTDWADWVDARSGALRNAPTLAGDADHPVLCAAPGTYVTS
jgi:polyhydroxyalkanoate synthase